MQSPYKSNIPKRPRNDLKRPQMTSEDANGNDRTVFKKVKTKKSLGSAI